MVPLVSTFPTMVTLAPMVQLAAEKRSGFSGYQRYHTIGKIPNGTIGRIPNARTMSLNTVK